MPKLVDETTYSRAATRGPKGDRGGLAAFQALLRAHATVTRRLERGLSGSPLSLSEYDVLVTLVAAPEATLRMKDLAARVLLTKSGITRLVDRLVERGLVSRHDCPVDRRGQYAVLTADGRTALRRAARVVIPAVAATFSAHLDQTERDTIVKALERVASANGAMLTE
jgi:DNA-binding MarR family transcriptional regulator